MKGLLTKDFLTIKKKYGLPRVIMDIAIIIALMFILEKSGTIYISFLLIPIEIGKPKVAICPECGEVSIYLEDLDRLN